MTKAHAEVARLFSASLGSVGNVGEEVFPGYPGLVVAPQVGGGETRTLELRSMAWGSPLVLKGKNGQPLKPRPVNNARAGSAADPQGHRSTASCGAIPFRSGAA